MPTYCGQMGTLPRHHKLMHSGQSVPTCGTILSKSPHLSSGHGTPDFGRFPRVPYQCPVLPLPRMGHHFGESNMLMGQLGNFQLLENLDIPSNGIRSNDIALNFQPSQCMPSEGNQGLENKESAIDIYSNNAIISPSEFLGAEGQSSLTRNYSRCSSNAMSKMGQAKEPAITAVMGTDSATTQGAKDNSQNDANSCPAIQTGALV